MPLFAALSTATSAEIHDMAEVVHGVVLLWFATIPFLLMLGFGVYVAVVSYRARRSGDVGKDAAPTIFRERE